MTIAVEEAILVGAPPESVWRFLADPMSWRFWWPQCKSAATADLKPLRDGSRLERAHALRTAAPAISTTTRTPPTIARNGQLPSIQSRQIPHFLGPLSPCRAAVDVPAAAPPESAVRRGSCFARGWTKTETWLPCGKRRLSINRF